MKGNRMSTLMIRVFFLTLIMGVVYAIAQVAGMSNPESVPILTAVVATPSSIDTLGAAGLRRLAEDKQLREDHVMPSIFTAIETSLKVIGNEIVVKKYGILMRVDPKLAAAGQSVRLAMDSLLTEHLRSVLISTCSDMKMSAIWFGANCSTMK